MPLGQRSAPAAAKGSPSTSEQPSRHAAPPCRPFASAKAVASSSCRGKSDVVLPSGTALRCGAQRLRDQLQSLVR